MTTPNLKDMILNVIVDDDTVSDITHKLIQAYPNYVLKYIGIGEKGYLQIRGNIVVEIFRYEGKFFDVNRTYSPYIYSIHHQDEGTVKSEKSQVEVAQDIIDKEMEAIIHDIEELEIIQKRLSAHKKLIRDVEIGLED